MRARLQSLTRPIAWLLLAAFLLPAMGAIGGEADTRLEMLVCSAPGAPISFIDLGGESEKERPTESGHCVFCFVAHCAPPAEALVLVFACLDDAFLRASRGDTVHLPAPPAWLKAPARAPPVSRVSPV